MTSEDGEMWNAIRKDRQEKRADNRKASPQILTEEGIEYASHNGGSHLVIETSATTIDFWPGTGLWIPRSGPLRNKRRRGVYPLVHHLKGIVCSNDAP